MKIVLQTGLWVAVFLMVSFGIGEMTRANMDWYNTLNKSPLNPPSIVFPIVWTFLYILLACTGALLWLKRKDDAGIRHLILFALYMIFNWAWSFIFFDEQMVFVGFMWIIISAVILAALMISLKVNAQKTEIYLLAPTFFWSMFAAYLNGYIYVAG